MAGAGDCDLCGTSLDGCECNQLACTFAHCEGGMYHQECVEKFLKSNRLEKVRLAAPAQPGTPAALSCATACASVRVRVCVRACLPA